MTCEVRASNASQPSVRQGEGSGGARFGQLGDSDVRHHRHGRHRDPLVGEHLLPAHEGQAAACAGCISQVGESGLRVVEEHHAEAAHDNVERFVEGRGLGVALDEVDVDPLFLGSPPGNPQHRR